VRQGWRTAVLGAVLLLLAAAYIVIRNTAPIERAPYIFATGDASVVELSIRNPETVVSFVKKNGAWEMSSPASYRVDTEKLSIIERFLLQMPVKRVMREGTTSAYGLETPEITVQFAMSNGSRHTLLVGNLTESKAQRFVRDPSRPFVFIVDIGSISQFEGSLAAYRLKQIFQVDMQSLNTVRLEKGRETIIELARKDEQWRIAAPFSAAVNVVELNELLVRLRELKAVDFVEGTAPDLEKLGLAPSAYTLTLRDDRNGMQTLQFGQTEANGFLSLRPAGGSDIMKVLASDIDFAGFQPQKLLGEAPLRDTIDNVRRIIVQEEGATAEFTVDSAAQPPAYTYRGARLDGGDFVTFYVKCINLVAQGYERWAPRGTAELVLTCELKDGSRKTLALFPRDPKTFYMQVNGGEVRFYTAAEQVALVRTWMKKLISSTK
jgi:hypothetical protein